MTAAPEAPVPAPARPHASDGLARGTSGVVYVEFIVAFIPVFILVLGIAQIALVYVGRMFVQHAAAVAARSASVVLPDDPQRYDSAAVNQLADRVDNCAPGAVDALANRIGAGLTVPTSLVGCGGGGGGSSAAATYAVRNARMRAVHDAASLALLAISPSTQQLDPQGHGRQASVAEALGSDAPAYRAVTGAMGYNRMAMAVTFPNGPGSLAYRNTYTSLDAEVTVRVTYAFHCAIPIARNLTCRARDAIGGVEDNELRVAPFASQLTSSAFAGQRFAVMRAEATMPLQRADYAY